MIETRQIQRLIQNLHRDLTSMGMARKRDVPALPGSGRKHVGIVRKENINSAGTDETMRLPEYSGRVTQTTR